MALPANDVDLVNIALVDILGHTTPIVALGDLTTEAKAANRTLDSVREVCLGEHDWKFARKMVPLVEIAAPPVTTDWWDAVHEDWDHVYTLPADCVTPRALYPGDRNPAPEDALPFERRMNEAGTAYVLLTDEDPKTTSVKSPFLLYTYRHTTVTLYPQPFVWFLCASLAIELAFPVIGFGDERAVAAQKYAASLRTVKFVDAVSFDSRTMQRDPRPTTPSLAARRGG